MKVGLLQAQIKAAKSTHKVAGSFSFLSLFWWEAKGSKPEHQAGRAGIKTRATMDVKFGACGGPWTICYENCPRKALVRLTA